MKTIQDYLNDEAKLDREDPTLKDLHMKIKQLRGSKAPLCFGYDDCSSLVLCQCPWRIDCEPS